MVIMGLLGSLNFAYKLLTIIRAFLKESPKKIFAVKTISKEKI